MSARSIRLRERLPLAFVAMLFLAGPTAGNIGSCNQTAEDLDAVKFFDAKQNLDCERCFECGVASATCDLACGPALAQAFPKGCYPLVHDGEVCLDAIVAASCSDFQRFVADEGARIPTECEFCPARDAGANP